MTIGGHLRRYATKLYHRSALFSTSRPQAQPPLNSRPQAQPPLNSRPQAQPPLNSRPQARPPPLITPSEVAAWVVFGAAYYAAIKWIGFHGRNMHQARKAEKAMRSRLEELDRKKEESPEAYLEMLQEEIRTLMFILSIREDLPSWEVEQSERKADVLESKLREWVEEVAYTAPAPVPAPVPQG